MAPDALPEYAGTGHQPVKGAAGLPPRADRAREQMRNRALSPEVLPLVLAWTHALHLPALARLALRWGQR